MYNVYTYYMNAITYHSKNYSEQSGTKNYSKY